MRRGHILIGMLLLTAAVVTVMLLTDGSGPAVQAQVVTVAKGSVRNAAALTGRLAYTGEHAAWAVVPGQVAEVYVKEGQRVAAGQALMRLDTGAMVRAASVWAEQDDPMVSRDDMQAILDSAVIRAPENATVRAILTQEHAPVMAGDMVALLSSNEQVIRCAAVERDVRGVQPGMRAEILVDGEEICRAEVTQVGVVEADETTGRLLCMVTLTPEERISLPAGAAVEADVLISGRSDVPVLPVGAITERGTVWWVHDGICTEIPAEIVLSDEMHAWVALPEGLAVAIGEFEDGQRIREEIP